MSSQSSLQPSSQPSSSQPSSLQPSSQANPRGWRWSKEQTLYFLRLLLQAKIDGKFNSAKKMVIRNLMVEFVSSFRSRWPQSTWSSYVLESKLTTLKRTWRAFRDLNDKSGTTYNEEEHKFYTSKENKKAFRLIWKVTANQLLRDGLLTDDSITVASWEEIFIDDLASGRFIAEAGDDLAFERQTDLLLPTQPLESYEAADNSGLDEIEVVQSEVSSNNMVTTEADEGPTASVEVINVDEDDDEGRVLPISTASSTKKKKRGISSDIPPNPGPDVGVARRKKMRSQGPTVEDVKELFLAVRSSERTHHIVPRAARAVGSEDLERAIRDVYTTLDDRNPDEILEVVKWLGKDTTRPVIWNALELKERKCAWIDSELKL